MKRYTISLVAIAAITVLGTKSAATTIEYTYYTGADSTDTSWINPTDSTSVKAVNFGQTSGTVTFGGVDWLPVTSPNSTNNDAPISMNYLYTEGDHFSAYYTDDSSEILTFGDYGATTNTINLSGFTVGQEYLVQFVLADTRGASADRTITIEGTSANVSGQNSNAYTFAYTDGKFSVVTAKFTPSAGDTAFTFTPTVKNSGSIVSNGTQINAIHVLTTPNVTGNDYDNWASTNGVIGTESDDDDNDGLTNFEEYAFGLNPTGGSSVNPITVPLDKATGTFSYTRRKVALTSRSYSIWTSSDLADWVKDNTADQTATAVPDTENESVVVTLTSAPTATKLFVQVRAN